MRTNVPLGPQEWAINAPTPVACKAKIAMDDAMLIWARNAVSDSVELDALRLATRAARWNDSNTEVDAYNALYVKMAMSSRDLSIVLIPRRSRCVNELSFISASIVGSLGLAEALDKSDSDLNLFNSL